MPPEMDKTCYIASCNNQRNKQPRSQEWSKHHNCCLPDDEYIDCISKLFNIDIEHVRAIKKPDVKLWKPQ